MPTPTYGFPYPVSNDSPNGAAQIQALATAVEGKFVTVDAAINTIIGGEYRASGTQSLITGPNKLNFGTTITAASGITWNGSNQFTTLTAGLYACSAMVYMPGGTGLNYAVYLGTSAATLFGPPGALFIDGVFSPNGLSASASVTVSLSAGTTISAYCYNNQATASTAFATVPAEFRVWRVR